MTTVHMQLEKLREAGEVTYWSLSHDRTGWRATGHIGDKAFFGDGQTPQEAFDKLTEALCMPPFWLAQYVDVFSVGCHVNHDIPWSVVIHRYDIDEVKFFSGETKDAALKAAYQYLQEVADNENNHDDAETSP